MSADRRKRGSPDAERPSFPTTGPWDAPASICDWLLHLEAEIHHARGHRPDTVILRRTIAGVECWLHDHRFPDG